MTPNPLRMIAVSTLAVAAVLAPPARAGCAGGRLAAIPLGDASKNIGLSTIIGRLPARAAKVDLCLSFTAKSVDPFWAIERVTLTPAN